MKGFISKWALFLTVAMVAGGVLYVQYGGAPIKVQNPWVRAAAANSKVMAGFMTLKNTTDQDLRLKSAVVESGFKAAELHRTTNIKGIMQMEEHESVLLRANSSLIFEPGSWHIMLLGASPVPSVGQTVRIELKFDNGQNIPVDFPVQKQ